MTRSTAERVLALLEASPDVGTHGHHRRRPGAQPQLSHARRRRAPARSEGDRSLQPDGPVGRRHGMAARLPGRARRGAHVLASLLHGEERRPAARQGRLRQEPRGATAAQPPGLRRQRIRPHVEPRLQPRGAVPAAQSGKARGRLQARARARSASNSTACSRSPTCRSSASPPISRAPERSGSTWGCS